MRPTDIVIQVQEGAATWASREWTSSPSTPSRPSTPPWSFPTWLRRLPAGRRRARKLDRRQPHHGPRRPDDGVQVAGKTFRVSTKYPRVVRQYFRKWGIYYYTFIDSQGALELHPSLGIADIIVDLTSSGTTLKDNRLREIKGGTVLESAACLIGHAPSLWSRWPRERSARWPCARRRSTA